MKKIRDIGLFLLRPLSPWRGHRLRAVLAVVLALVLSPGAFPQVRGKVTSSEGGAPIPGARVTLATGQGVLCDGNGEFHIDMGGTTPPLATTLTVSCEGFGDMSLALEWNGEEKDLSLILNPAVVSMGVPTREQVSAILDSISARRHLNDPEAKTFQCDVYSKMEVLQAKGDGTFWTRATRGRLNFARDYIDSTSFEGSRSMPLIFAETRSRRFREDGVDKENIIHNRTTGVDDENSLARFMGVLNLKADFYLETVKLLGTRIPSPASPASLDIYEYTSLEYLTIGGRPALRLSFRRSPSSTSHAWEGTMTIDREDYAIVRMDVGFRRGRKASFLRTLDIDQLSRKWGDTLWFYDRRTVKIEAWAEDKLRKAHLQDLLGSELYDIQGKRTEVYSSPSMHIDKGQRAYVGQKKVTVNVDCSEQPASYWDASRPVPLTPDEKGVYSMYDTFMGTPNYKWLYAIGSIAAHDYIDVGPVSIGQILKTYQTNSTEGQRFYFGMRTSVSLSKRVRLGGYVAYGVKDASFKGKAYGEYMFSYVPFRKLTVTGIHDYAQLGNGTKGFYIDNFFSSALKRSKNRGKIMTDEVSVIYDREFCRYVNANFGVEYYRLYSNERFPMVVPGGPALDGVDYLAARARLHFSFDDITAKSPFKIKYKYSRLPIVTLDLTYAPGLNDYPFLRTEASVDYRQDMGVLGKSRFHLGGGAIFGQVPYPFLYHFPGNGTYLYKRNAFNTMDFYEFTADRWVSFYWEHDLRGAIFGHIPLIRDLGLHEIVGMKAGYGTISDLNDGRVGSRNMASSPMVFPETMGTMGTVPYVEAGAGIGKILGFLRVDFTWRLTHRTRMVDGVEVPADNLFVTTVGAQFRF